MKDTYLRCFCFFLLLILFSASYNAVAQPMEYSSILNRVSLARFGTLAFGDFDLDGRQDLFLTGSTSLAPFAQFLQYTGIISDAGTPRIMYTEILQQQIRPVVFASSVVFDVDRDGDLDVLTTGALGIDSLNVAETMLYYNGGGFRFFPLSAGMTGLYGGSAAWGDYDNDGDPDVVLTGIDPSAGDQFTTNLFRNDGTGWFQQVDIQMEGKAFGDAAWGDYDNDGDLDLIVTGASSLIDAEYRTVLFRNDGDDEFTEIPVGFIGLFGGSVDWGDYDSDGDLDLLMTGSRPAPGAVTRGYGKIYRNESGSFVDTQADIVGISHGDAHWGDYNGDGHLDILIAGFKSALAAMSKSEGRDAYLHIYLQSSAGQFEHSIRNIGFMFGTTTGADFDADGDLDFISTGEGLGTLSRVYFNQARVLNAPPAAPTGLTEEVVGQSVTLQWNPATDALTPGAGLSYNIRVGTQPGGIDVVAPLCLGDTGLRLVSAIGNVNLNRSWPLRNLPAGTYYWSVQALDHAFVGSVFAEERSFTIE